MWDLTIHSVSGSNIIYNSISTLLVDIVRFGPLRIVVSLTILKRVCYGEISTLLQRILHFSLDVHLTLTFRANLVNL